MNMGYGRHCQSEKKIWIKYDGRNKRGGSSKRVWINGMDGKNE